MPRTVSLALSLSLPLLTLGCPLEVQQVTPPAPVARQTDATPAGQAAPAPAPQGPIDRSKLRTPWRLAKVGDFAVYKVVKFNKKQRFEITGVGDRTVSFSITDVDSGKKLNDVTLDLAEEEERYKAPEEYDFRDGEITTQTVEVNGKPLEVRILKRKAPSGTSENWLAEDTIRPFIQSAVKSFKDGNLEFELLDFGVAQGE